MAANDHMTVGTTVLWSSGVGSPWAAAIVTKVGNDTINVTIFPEGRRELLTRAGVRHMDDPWLISHPTHDQGIWNHTDRDRKINRVLDEMADLTAKPKTTTRQTASV